MTRYILDIYNGDGVEGEAKQCAGTVKRAAMRAAKALAETNMYETVDQRAFKTHYPTGRPWNSANRLSISVLNNGWATVRLDWEDNKFIVEDFDTIEDAYRFAAQMGFSKGIPDVKTGDTNEVVVTPADDDVISYGPLEGAPHDDCYVTVRALNE